MKISELLDSEDKWTRGVSARDINNECVDLNSIRAVKWCLFGAICKCYQNNYDSKRIVKMARHVVYDISKYNDHPNTTFEDIKRLVVTLDI